MALAGVRPDAHSDEVAMPPAFCTNCGSPHTRGSAFCTSCGAPVGGPSAPAPPGRSRSGPPTWVMLAIAAIIVASAGAITWLITTDGSGGGGGSTVPGGNHPAAIDALGPGPGPQQGVVATFGLGPETPIGGDTIGPDGGVISGADGITISVPAAAHGEAISYTITAQEITSHDLPAPMQAVSSLYRVDNGGVLADLPVEVDIPISIPAGEFAMGFFYDRSAGSFEGMPIVGLDGDSVTVATRHFSEIVVLWYAGMPIGQLPAPTVDTGFRPGIDDWQFVNLGSAVEPEGHCSGQSLAALWYYTEKKKAGDPALYGLFDNTDADPLNRVWPGTRSLWEDDRDGYRLASALQVAQYAGGMGSYETSMFNLARRLHFSGRDGLSFSAFGMAMLVSGEPQFVGIDRYVDPNGDGVWTDARFDGGHAMVVYGATESGLYVADPNYPGAFRMIPWDPAARVLPSVTELGVLGPYSSALKAGGPGTVFNVIGYSAKSGLVDWADLGGHWPQFVAGTVGDPIFPGYGLSAVYVDGNGNAQNRGFRGRLVVAVDRIELTGDVAGEDWRLQVYDGDTLLGTAEKGGTETVPIELDEGDNDVGVYLSVKRPQTDPPGYWWAFVDFDRITITRGSGLSVAMLPNESEAAGLEMLIKDPPTFVENPDVPGEIIAIAASYKAGPAVLENERDEPGRPYRPGWKVLDPIDDDVCSGSGWGGAAAGFGPNLCISVRLSIWDEDPAPFDPVVVRAEEQPTPNGLPPTLAVPEPCNTVRPQGVDYDVTFFPCVESAPGSVDMGAAVYGFHSFDRNYGAEVYSLRAVVEGIRVEIATDYNTYGANDVQIDRMREVLTALVNDIAQKIRADMGG